MFQQGAGDSIYLLITLKGTLEEVPFKPKLLCKWTS